MDRETSLQTLCKQLMAREKDIASKEKLYGSIAETERELDAIQRRVADGNEELKSLETSIRRKSEEHDKMMREFEAVADLKEQRLNRAQKCYEETEKEFEVKRERLRELQQGRFEDGEKELKENEEILRVIKSEISSCLGELTVNEKRLSLVKELNKRNSETWSTMVENRSREFESKVRRFEGWIKDVELKEGLLGSTSEELHSIRKNVDECLEKAESKESATVLLQSLSPEAQLGAYLKKRDLVCGEMFTTLQASDNPAMLALRVIQRNIQLDASRRSSSLCDLLMRASPSSITPRVREEAMKLARDWKGQLSAASENRLEVWDFLQFLVSYNLSSEFDAGELRGLLGVVGLNSDPPQSRPCEGRVKIDCPSIQSKRKVGDDDDNEFSTGPEGTEECHRLSKVTKISPTTSNRNPKSQGDSLPKNDVLVCLEDVAAAGRLLKRNPKAAHEQQRIGSTEKASILERAHFESPWPNFKVVIQQSYAAACGCYLSIPSDFCEGLIKKDCDIVLWCEGKSWPAEIYIRPQLSGKRAAVQAGWKKFAADNDLKVRDICLFELVDKVKMSFNVQIHRYKAKE